jgi:hypothetical protein
VETKAESKQAAKTLFLAMMAFLLVVAVDPMLAWLILAGRMTLVYVYIIYGFAWAVVITVWLGRYLLRDENAPMPKRRLWGMY